MEEAVDTFISMVSALQGPSRSNICCPVSHVQYYLEEPAPTLAMPCFQSLLWEAHVHAFQFALCLLLSVTFSLCSSPH